VWKLGGREAGREGVMGEGFEGRKPAHSPYQQTLTFVLSILDKIWETFQAHAGGVHGIFEALRPRQEGAEKRWGSGVGWGLLEGMENHKGEV
jgi:hypothetical protein